MREAVVGCVAGEPRLPGDPPMASATATLLAHGARLVEGGDLEATLARDFGASDVTWDANDLSGLRVARAELQRAGTEDAGERLGTILMRKGTKIGDVVTGWDKSGDGSIDSREFAKRVAEMGLVADKPSDFRKSRTHLSLIQIKIRRKLPPISLD